MIAIKGVNDVEKPMGELLTGQTFIGRPGSCTTDDLWLVTIQEVVRIDAPRCHYLRDGVVVWHVKEFVDLEVIVKHRRDC